VTAVQVRVWVEHDPGDELRSLHGWLLEEPAVRRYGEPAIRSEVRPGALGSADILALALGSGLSAAQLIATIVGWRATRPQKYLVRVQGNGRTVEVRTDDEAEIPRLAGELEQALKPEAG
jgi:hypothetical protein